MYNKDQLHKDWLPFFEEESAKPYFKELNLTLSEKEKSETVLPNKEYRFKAFEMTGPRDIRCVICGQDPYHDPSLAMGLSFSIPREVKKYPSSLINIRKEILRNHPGATLPNHGDLTGWSNQGVFLLNTVLTVAEKQAGSHAKKLGWEIFTSNALSYINNVNDGLVFLAWGKFAHKLSKIIDNPRHTIIKTSHPSGLGHYRDGRDFCAFTGSNCFNNANAALASIGKPTIDWLAL